MFDDDAARHALRTLTDEPEPPIATTFDQVLRRGRRRVFVQRAGAVAGVVAVVAAIGIGALLLRPGDQSGNGVRVADTPTSNTGGPEGTRTTERPPASIVLPGWQVAEPVDGVVCDATRLSPPEPEIVLRPEGIVKGEFADAVAVVRAQPPVSINSDWQAPSPKHDAPRGYVSVEVPMDNGNGQFQLETGRFGGAPEQAADADLFAYGTCELPQRRILADGTVMQLYPVTGGQQAPLQYVRIYQPDGLFYFIAAAGYSEADLVRIDGSSSETINGGRGKLPTTEQQLAEIAEKFVTNLE